MSRTPVGKRLWAPRLGYHLDLLGCAVLFYALVGGAPVGQMLAGIALTATAALCKVAGRDRFRLQRLQRR